MNFLPHTDADRRAMLDAMGVHTVDALFDDIPGALREAVSFSDLPVEGLSEPELEAHIRAIAAQNTAAEMPCFLGAGAYARFIPMAVNTIAQRSEFYTAYTPYQPEISQGTLQVGYTFQTMIAGLTGMDVANASVYDAGTAMAEAMLMAARQTRRHRVLVQGASANPLNFRDLRGFSA